MNWLIFTLVVIAIGLPLSWRLTFRIEMEFRARALLQLHPHAEKKMVYLPLPCALPAKKRTAIEALIVEMRGNGWIFVRMSEANPLRTLLAWGGGVNMHFIRKPSA